MLYPLYLSNSLIIDAFILDRMLRLTFVLFVILLNKNTFGDEESNQLARGMRVFLFCKKKKN